MPVIDISQEELEELVGKKLTRDQLEEVLPKIKCEVEGIEGDKISVEVTSDRIDLLSVGGIARSLKSYLELKPGLSRYQIQPAQLEVIKEEVPVRPYLACARVKGLNLDQRAIEGLMQFQEKVHSTYGRTRKRVSIGLHDPSRLTGPYTYKAVKPDSVQFKPLGLNQQLNLDQILDKHKKGQAYGQIISQAERYPLIVDKEGQVLSFPPIINGQITEVKPGTKELFIDITGTRPEPINYALNALVTSLAEGGGKIESVAIKLDEGTATTPELEYRTRKISLKEIERVIGQQFDVASAGRYFKRMGYGLDKEEKGEENGLKVIVPPYRSDILHDIDLIEDIAIGFGYENLKPEVPNIFTVGQRLASERINDKAREILTGFGYQEVNSPLLSSEEVLFKAMRREIEEAQVVELKNPISDKYSLARDMILPQLLEFLAHNTHCSYPQKIYEQGRAIYADDRTSNKVACPDRIAGAIADKNSNYNLIRGHLEGIMEALGYKVRFKEASKPFYLAGRSARVYAVIEDSKEKKGESSSVKKGKPLGYLGEINPQLLTTQDISMPVVAFEIDLDFIKPQAAGKP